DVPLAAPHADLEPRLRRQLADDAHADDDRRCAVQADAAPQALEHAGARPAVDLDLVDALDALLAGEKPRRERAVVREQEEAARLKVEASDRIQPLGNVAHEIADGGPPFRVG